MRSKGKMVVFAVLAVLAFSAVATAAASAALPEFKPVPTKKKFTSTSGAVTWRESTFEIECSKGTSTGEITSASTVGKVVMKFTGCVAKTEEGKVCSLHSAGSKNNEEIVTEPLKGELGTVPTSQAASGVGLLLEGESKNVLFYFAASATCGTLETVVEGTFAGEVSPIGKKQLTSKLVIAAEAGGTNSKIREITVKRGTVKPKIKGLFGTSMSLERTDETAFEEALEVT